MSFQNAQESEKLAFLEHISRRWLHFSEFLKFRVVKRFLTVEVLIKSASTIGACQREIDTRNFQNKPRLKFYEIWKWPKWRRIPENEGTFQINNRRNYWQLSWIFDLQWPLMTPDRFFSKKLRSWAWFCLHHLLTTWR